MEMEYGEGVSGCPLPIRDRVWGGGASPEKYFIFGSRNAYYGAFFGPSEYLLLQCNTSRCRPALRLPTLTFQADCGSIKGAVMSAEEGPERYLPWW